MYETHFGLRIKPFAVTPNPRFLYPARSHREALAALVYGVKHRRGFICLVGEVGTGKTTLLRALLERLDVSLRTVLITHTTLDREGLLRMILHDLLIPHASLIRVEMIQALHDFVIAELESGHFPPLLILDEAQNLDDEVLEEIRLLTNLEIGDTKLLQVILSGQPELEQKLARPRLRQLGQRIAVRAKLQPLDREETVAYVHHRLRVAGAQNLNLFSRAALRTVWVASKGIPRLINMVCEQALVNAFGANRSSVNEALVEEAAHDLGLGRPNGSGGSPNRQELAGGRRSTWRTLLRLGGAP
jgi:general secretion pathway protein A